MQKLLVASCLLLFFISGDFVSSQEKKIHIDISPTLKWLEHPTAYKTLILNPDVRSELDLSESQSRKIEAALNKIEDLQKEYRSKSRKISDLEEVKRLREKLLNDMSKNFEVVKSELLPHQQKRFRQIAFQYYQVFKKPDDRTVAISPFLASKVVSSLQMTKVQKKKIEEVYRQRNNEIRKAYAEYEKRFREIQNKSQAQIFSVLTKEQKIEAEDKVGPPAAVIFAPDRVGSALKK